jgi:hypothetical protein
MFPDILNMAPDFSFIYDCPPCPILNGEIFNFMTLEKNLILLSKDVQTILRANQNVG